MTVQSHILGLGGVFFKSNDPKSLEQWYRDTLGFSTRLAFDETDEAISFKWKTFDGKNHCTVWAPFPEDSTYFEPSNKQFMINYVVKDLYGLLAKLKEKGIEQAKEIQDYKFGKFGTILDPENNIIEFWEPDEKFFEKLY